MIKRFVQEMLGCGCPEEVFRSIEAQRNVRLNSFIVLSARIVIGNRLLIYVTEPESEGCIEEHLPVLVTAGMDEKMHLHVIHTKANPFATESTENSEERLK